MQDLRQFKIIESNQRDIFGHTYSQIDQGAESIASRQIVRAEEGSGRVLFPNCGGHDRRRRLLRGAFEGWLGLQASLDHGTAIPFEARPHGVKLAVESDKDDAPVAVLGNQVLHCAL